MSVNCKPSGSTVDKWKGRLDLGWLLSRGGYCLVVLCLLAAGWVSVAPVEAQQEGGAQQEGEVQQEQGSAAGVPGINSVNVGASGLPLPRFVSLRSGRVNVRIGPDARLHAVAWTYMRQGLPVEIIEEYDNWRRIRDSEGDGGWVDQAFLSGRRTVMPAPWIEGRSLVMRQQPSETGVKVAEIEAGVIGHVRQCRQGWCEIDIKAPCDLVEPLEDDSSSPLPQFLSDLFSLGDCARNYHGWLKQTDLWGVYPDEDF